MPVRAYDYPLDATTSPRGDGRPAAAGGPTLRVVEAIGPTEEDLAEITRAFPLEPSAIEHVQDRAIGPGVAVQPHALIVRLDVPGEGDGDRIARERVDVILGPSFVVIAEPRDLALIERARERYASRPERGGDWLLAVIVDQVVDAYREALQAIERDLDAAIAEGRSRAEPVATIRRRLGDFDRSAAAIRDAVGALSERRTRLIGAGAAVRLHAAQDRLNALVAHAAYVRERAQDAVDGRRDEAPRALGAESPEIITTAAEVGERRLRRLTVAHAITALIGGLAVSFGAVALAWTAGPWLGPWGEERAQLLGALAFPIGFVILLIGKGELFTENFFVPVTGVMAGRGSVRDLLQLWGYTLFFNLAGGAIFAFLITRPGVLGAGPREFMVQYAMAKVHYAFGEALVKAIFAGWLMTMLTWLILAAEGLGPRLAIIWMIGFLIVAGHFNHVVISAAEIFIAMGLGAPISLAEWLRGNFIPALIGNLIGGVVFVTLLGYLQAHTLQRGEEQRAEDASRERR